VSVELEITAREECEVELQVAVARSPGLQVTENLTLAHRGRDVAATESPTLHGGRLHLATLPRGRSLVTYRASISGSAEMPKPTPADLSLYRRPSRYAQSDTFGGFAAAEFAGVPERELLGAVSSWVGTRLDYVPGSSGPTDGATDTLLAGAGVCRDYAHLVIALLRARGIPARLVAVYAPGCEPMDFHAVVEAHVEQGWYVVDATALAPRASLIRIATGRDAADTAFMANVSGGADLERSVVLAVADHGLPADDVYDLVAIS
jgi:transglutaminase-like putative cysteine protease